MAVPELKLAARPSAGMDRQIQHGRWSPARWPLGAKVGGGAAAVLLLALIAWLVASRASIRTVRLPPQVRNGRFTLDLDFEGASPTRLVSGEAAQGRLQLGDDMPARIVPVGPFLERTGGDWVFVVAKGGDSAERRRIKVGRRTSEQLEILSGLAVGEQVITSD